MADLLLIYPKAGHDVRGVSVNAPMALLTIAASVLPHYSVQILDQRVEDNFWDALKAALIKRPLLVGVTSMSGTQIYYALEITKFVKAHSDVPVVWGGMHSTIYPKQTLVKPYIDFVIKGEGEPALLPLLHCLSERRSNFESVAGLYWKENREINCNPLAPPFEMDQMNKIPWHLVSVEEYTSPSQFLYNGIRRLLPYEGSRGCPFKCTYCSQPVLTRKYRIASPTKIVEECLEMVSKFNLDHIAFFDDEFFVNKKWAIQVAEAINGQFSWWAQTRAADLLRVDLKRMEQCGLRVLAPGLETGSDRLLKASKKGERVEEYREANRRLAETTITVQYNFMVGFPTETEKERHETVDLILELLETNPNAIVNQVSPLTPLPGTELLREVVAKYGYVEPNRLEGWIQVTRGRQERSWLNRQDLRQVRFLYYTSYFLCTAERYAQKLKIPKWILSFYGSTIRMRWKNKWLWLDWEIPLLRLIFRRFINPIDYSLPANYGDDFSDDDGRKTFALATQIPTYA